VQAQGAVPKDRRRGNRFASVFRGSKTIYFQRHRKKYGKQTQFDPTAARRGWPARQWALAARVSSGLGVYRSTNPSCAGLTRVSTTSRPGIATNKDVDARIKSGHDEKAGGERKVCGLEAVDSKHFLKKSQERTQFLFSRRSRAAACRSFAQSFD